MRKRASRSCCLLLNGKAQSNSRTFFSLVGAFVRLLGEIFDEGLQANPVVWLQGDELQSDAPVAAPADHGLLDRQRRFVIRLMDAERQKRTGMHRRRRDDAAAAQGQIDDATFPVYPVD